MSKICHAHCPESGFPWGILAVVAVAAAAVYGFMASYGSLVLAAGFALVAVAAVSGAWIVRRSNRTVIYGGARIDQYGQSRGQLPARRSAAISAPVIRALPAAQEGSAPVRAATASGMPTSSTEARGPRP